jgi:dTDP-4-dehydrorhamnose reductase
MNNKTPVHTILVTGANGQLGSEIKALSQNYDYTFYFTDKETLDITDISKIEQFLEKNSINTIINCAAYTAVDKAEEERDTAKRINADAVKNLAILSKNKGIKLIHISTDYVFDGKNHIPYKENDTVNPQSVYGTTKLEGEQNILDINPKHSIIIRTSWVYSTYGANFVKTMIRLGNQKDELGVIFDQVGTPTYAQDLAQAILDILPQINNEKIEIFHYSNEGVCSWYDFAKEIMQIARLECRINPIETKDYPTPAARPNYSILNKSKIKETYALSIPYWKESLHQCIEKLQH